MKTQRLMAAVTALLAGHATGQMVDPDFEIVDGDWAVSGSQRWFLDGYTEVEDDVFGFFRVENTGNPGAQLTLTTSAAGSAEGSSATVAAVRGGPGQSYNQFALGAPDRFEMVVDAQFDSGFDEDPVSIHIAIQQNGVDYISTSFETLVGTTNWVPLLVRADASDLAFVRADGSAATSLDFSGFGSSFQVGFAVRSSTDGLTPRASRVEFDNFVFRAFVPGPGGGGVLAVAGMIGLRRRRRPAAMIRG